MNVLEELQHALVIYEEAEACVRENRGHDKNLARESLEHEVGERLVPALHDAIDELEAKQVARVAKFAVKLLKRKTA